MVAASWSSLQQVSGHARSLEEPCQWPGSSLDCGFRGSNVRLLHFFFFKQLCLEKIGRDCCGSSISQRHLA